MARAITLLGPNGPETHFVDDDGMVHQTLNRRDSVLVSSAVHAFSLWLAESGLLDAGVAGSGAAAWVEENALYRGIDGGGIAVSFKAVVDQWRCPNPEQFRKIHATVEKKWEAEHGG